jgi:hypothetical protein
MGVQLTVPLIKCVEHGVEAFVWKTKVGKKKQQAKES